MIKNHPAYEEALELGRKEDKKIHTVLAEVLERLRLESAEKLGKSSDNYSLTELTKDIHIYPDLHGIMKFI